MRYGSSDLELRKFVVPEFVFGLGARKLAVRYAYNFSISKVLIVTDQQLREETPWVEELLELLSSYGIACSVFDKVSQNPRAAEVMDGSELYRQEHCTAIIALGGGSVMDCAKGIGIVSSNGGHILDYEGVDNIPKPMPPLICIPTTSGTGSEVSQFAIILDELRRTKIAIVSKAVVPDIGLIDPETTVTMDAWLTACTGMDALTHAIEAYVSNASSPITDVHALEAISLIWENLPAALEDRSDVMLRYKLMLGSLQAGIAFSNAILGAVHAMAHSLGGYLDLPHGVCNAILLAPVCERNYSSCPERYRTISRLLGVQHEMLRKTATARALAERIDLYRNSIGVCGGLRDLGVRKQDLSALAAHAVRDACLATNPCLFSQQDLEEIYEQAF